jgi:hypothetical protein
MLTLGQILLLKLHILSLHKVLVLVLCNLELLMVYKNILIVKGNETISGFVVEPLYHTNVTGHLVLVIPSYSLYYFIIIIVGACPYDPNSTLTITKGSNRRFF